MIGTEPNGASEPLNIFPGGGARHIPRTLSGNRLPLRTPRDAHTTFIIVGPPLGLLFLGALRYLPRVSSTPTNGRASGKFGDFELKIDDFQALAVDERHIV